MIKSSFDQLKQAYPLRQTIASLLGKPKIHKSDADYYPCPFHKDHSPSFVVYEHHCKCYANCPIHGREWGDLLDFLMEYWHMNTPQEVAEKLGQVQLVVNPVKKRALNPSRHTLKMDDVMEGYTHVEDARTYFHQRGISDAQIDTHKLGIRTWSHKLNRSDFVMAQRFTLPDIAYGMVRNIDLRLDEAKALQDLKSGLVDAKIISQVCDQYKQEHGNFPSTPGLITLLFGPRYTQMLGGIQGGVIFNIEVAIQRHEDGWFLPTLPYLLIHEGKFKAMAMQSLGFPSISCKGASGLSHLFNVRELIVVQDNEPDKLRPDGSSFNPGASFARHNLEATGRSSHVRIIRPPQDFKGADDVVVAGAAIDWMAQEGIHPYEIR